MHRLTIVVVILSICGLTYGQPSSGLEVLQSMESALTGAIEKADRSVVAIAVVPKSSGFRVTDSLQFNLPGTGKPLIDPTNPNFIPREFATGVIISESGDVLTTYHVLGNPKENDYYVWHQGTGHEASVHASPARVQAGDPWTDMAVLRFEAAELQPIRFGDASQLRRGSFVISLGNPYAVARDGRASASLGIVSNLQRSSVPKPNPDSAGSNLKDQLHEYGTLIQTDAKLNLGTSGGPLLNLKGEMVGLTTALAAVAGYEEGAGFAIPIDAAAKATIQQLADGKVPAFGFLGLEPTNVPNQSRLKGVTGAIVRQVIRGMPAQQAGLRSGDLITEVDGLKINDAIGLFREMSRRPAHSRVKLTVLSGNPIAGEFRARTVDVKLGKKHLALAKPAYSIHPDPNWRGMMVDHGTALPPGALFGFSRPQTVLPVAVTRVDPDSRAWSAGIRPGQFIKSINGNPCLDPSTFYDTVAALPGPVQLGIATRENRDLSVTIAAESPSDAEDSR